MGYFSIHMHLASESGRIHLLKRNEELHISHILFADDMLVFCRANKSSVLELNRLLQKLYLNTGLLVNREKSKIYFSKSCKHKTDLAAILGMQIISLPTKYLGLPLSISYIKTRHFTPLIDKCRTKVAGWMLKSCPLLEGWN